MPSHSVRQVFNVLSFIVAPIQETWHSLFWSGLRNWKPHWKNRKFQTPNSKTACIFVKTRNLDTKNAKTANPSGYQNQKKKFICAKPKHKQPKKWPKPWNWKSQHPPPFNHPVSVQATHSSWHFAYVFCWCLDILIKGIYLLCWTRNAIVNFIRIQFYAIKLVYTWKLEP